jgi:hypothetical protein
VGLFCLQLGWFLVRREPLREAHNRPRLGSSVARLWRSKLPGLVVALPARGGVGVRASAVNDHRNSSFVMTGVPCVVAVVSARSL